MPTARSHSQLTAAIDFGTSNSAVALVGWSAASTRALTATPTQVHLVPLEAQQPTMPTAVFFRSDTPAHQAQADMAFGRAALAAYTQADEGRLMRSMKSLLGSSLWTHSTDLGAGRSVRYRDVVVSYLRELKARAEAQAGAPITQAVLGRPVYFVDDDPERDRAAQAALEEAARAVGFATVAFQYEPIAAALDHEARTEHEELVLVADLGGGTCDFSLVRVGPQRRQRLDRKADILANHGVHVAGTDFDRRISLQRIQPLLGYGSQRVLQPGERVTHTSGAAAAGAAPEVPSGIYFDLATWHLINTLYNPTRLAEARALRGWYRSAVHHTRLMRVLTEHLGHSLAHSAEDAKITTATEGHATIDLRLVEPGLSAPCTPEHLSEALHADIAQIQHACLETVRQAGVPHSEVAAVYVTGGSSGLPHLVQALAAPFPQARLVRGERFSSVVQGLGQFARLWAREHSRSGA